MRVDDTIRNINYPIDIELMGIPESFDDDLESIVNDAELMGVDFNDPELMGGFIKKLVKRLKKRIRARKKKRGGKRRTFSVSSSEGTATLGPGGLNITRSGVTPGTGGLPGFMQPVKSGVGGLFENPMMLLLPAGLLVMMMLKKKKK
jgi:hypothetical protein